jgi:hypothetical protein
VALEGHTVRQAGLIPPPVIDASLAAPAGVAKGVGGSPSIVGGVLPPTGLYIPGFDGNPHVGTLQPKETLPTWGGGSIDGQTIEGYKIIGGSNTLYSNTTLRNCWIYGGTSSGSEFSYNILARGNCHLIMEDCHVGEDGYYPDRHIYFADSGRGTIRRTYLQGGEDMLKFKSGCLFEMIEAGPLEPPPNDPDPHGDNIQTESTNLGTSVEGYASILRYSNLPGNWYNPRPTLEATNTSAVIIKADLGTVDNVLLDNNYMNGGNATLHLYHAKYTCTNIHVRNNIFGLDYRYGMLNIQDGTVGTWTNNKDVNGNPVTIPPSRYT